MVFRRLARHVGARLEAGLDAGAARLTREAEGEIDVFMAQQRSGMWQPMAIVAVLLAGAVIAGYAIVEPEPRRVVAATFSLAAAIYGTIIFIAGSLPTLPLLRLWFALRAGPERLAAFVLHRRILIRLRAAIGNGTGAMLADAAFSAARLAGGPASLEALSLSIARRAAPRLVRHATTRGLALLGPPIAVWSAIRLIVVPLLVADGTGLPPLETLAYPFAALADALSGTHWRDFLLR